MSGFTAERFTRVWSDDAGDYIEVRPDADALGMVSLGYSNGTDKAQQRLCMVPAQARLIAKAVLELADELEKQK